MTDASNHATAGAGQAAAPSAAGKTVASTLGEIVWLMSQSAEHKGLAIGDLEHLIMPAILVRQFRLFYEKEQPVGAVIYARISDEVKARLAQEVGRPRLALTDWQSGPEIHVVEVIAPFGAAQQLADETVALLQSDPSTNASPPAGNA